MRKRILSVSPRKNILTDRKIFLSTSLRRVYGLKESTIVYTAFIPHTFVGLSLILIPGDMFVQ